MSTQLIVAAAVLTTLGIGASAQQPARPQTQERLPAPPSSAVAPATQPLKVSLVISRYRGDKRVGSLPYVLGVTIGRPTSLRMGVDVPVVMGQKSAGPPGSPVSYRSVGTNIDCTANPAGEGVYALNLVVEDSSAQLQADEKSNAAFAGDIPTFRTFKSSFTAMMRDGQTTQYTSATDPVTGEVMRIDVTLNLLR